MADAPSPSPWPRPDGGRTALPLLVDCDGCAVRGSACADCVVSVLLGPPPEQLELAPEEVSALDTLAAAGLVPPLRLVTPTAPSGVGEEPPEPDDEHNSHTLAHPG